MRLILGLDAPTAGTVTVNGKPYRAMAAPVREVGALLDSRSVHTGRSGRNHLLALVAITGVPTSRVDHLLAIVGLADVNATGPARWCAHETSRARILRRYRSEPALIPTSVA